MSEQNSKPKKGPINGGISTIPPTGRIGYSVIRTIEENRLINLQVDVTVDAETGAPQNVTSHLAWSGVSPEVIEAAIARYDLLHHLDKFKAVLVPVQSLRPRRVAALDKTGHVIRREPLGRDYAIVPLSELAGAKTSLALNYTPHS